jgi:hypothetical protein
MAGSRLQDHVQHSFGQMPNHTLRRSWDGSESEEVHQIHNRLYIEVHMQFTDTPPSSIPRRQRLNFGRQTV